MHLRRPELGHPPHDSEPVTSQAPSKPLEAVTTDSSDTYIYAGHLEAPPLLADLPALQEEPAIVKTRRRYTLLYVNIICPLKSSTPLQNFLETTVQTYTKNKHETLSLSIHWLSRNSLSWDYILREEIGSWLHRYPQGTLGTR